MAKGLGIALVGLLAIAGGIAAAAIITKKKLEKENEEDYYDEWDDAEWLDDEDFDFDEVNEIVAETFADADEAGKKNEDLIEEAAEPAEESDGQL